MPKGMGKLNRKDGERVSVRFWYKERKPNCHSGESISTIYLFISHWM